MVLILRNINSGKTVVLGGNNTYTFGRSRINNIQLKDYTCSNRHAILEVKDGQVTLTDVGSKNGIFVNKRRIKERKLIFGDIICFGLNDCIYTFIDPKFQTVLDKSNSENDEVMLQEMFTKLGVILVENYSKECTHFTTDSVSLNTLKETQILDTLIDKKPVVAIKFWEIMLKNFEEGAEIPNIYKCLPEIDNSLKENGVQNIIPRKNRTILFKDTVCIFFKNSSEMILKNLMIKCGGEIIQHDGEANFAVTLEDEIKFDTAIIVLNIPKEKQTLVETYFIDKMKQCYPKVEVLEPDDIYIIILNGYWPNDRENEKNNNKQRCNGSESAQSGPSNINQASDSGNCVVLGRPNGCPTKKSHNINQTKSQNTKITQWISVSKKNIRYPRTSQSSYAGKRNEAFNFNLSMSSDDTDNSSIEIIERDNNDVQSPAPVLMVDDSDNDETDIEVGTSGIVSWQPKTLGGENHDLMKSTSSSESPEIVRKMRFMNTPSTPGTSHFVIESDDELGGSETPNIPIKIEQSINATSSCVRRSKRLKINPLAKLKRAKVDVHPNMDSQNRNSATDIEQCKKLFADAEFITL